MVIVFSNLIEFGCVVNEMKLMVLTGTVFVISILLVLVYKTARVWDDFEKEELDSNLLPLFASRATNRWVNSRKAHFGRLGTIQENEVFSPSTIKQQGRNYDRSSES
ncbi:uncharacterized protein PHALS_15270 [Plasmopara halstedii]|uniref:Uncharacterized protein n=1 Tax=Plasmopara halstedii TaxID=4781 RepID=A0A0P1B678_PLAHL|nr:uncharacterized protein PHALS_15270 [Plasmopara halstedii]CEG50344.1 hypothetical protein PHALS_15270 [Plasmopara halstedii]|eukprot:XP_024586713.1 hypothetical protein PHALS_15270 [Plasmopara halstedii]